MLKTAANGMVALDVTTLFVVATGITALLGLLLLSAWMQERVRALGWWGAAYLVGGFSMAIWSVESALPLPAGSASALVFVACGMIWSAARIFHGRAVIWPAMLAGAAVWLCAGFVPSVAGSPAARIVLSSVIISVYTFLAANELWHERRKTLLRRWPAVFVPILHGAVFLFPIPLAGLIPDEGGIASLSSGWVSVLVLEILLYVVGSAFLVLVLSKERAVRVMKDAAATDELTRLLNRRGFFAAAEELIARQTKAGAPVSVLMFDLDHFKSINDRWGHYVGDQALRLFASVMASTLRASDVIGRLGGEEFVAILPGALADARIAAERVRAAFEAAAITVAGCPLAATVSIGIASTPVCYDMAGMLMAADSILYSAKRNGRNRVEGVEQKQIPPVPAPAGDAADVRQAEALRTRGPLTVVA